MPCIPSARDITVLYPVGTATIVTIDIDADLSFVTKRDTNMLMNKLSSCKNEIANVNLDDSKGHGLLPSEQAVRTGVADL